MACGSTVKKMVNVFNFKDTTSQKPPPQCHLETLYSPNETELDSDSGIDVVSIPDLEPGTSAWIYPLQVKENSTYTANDVVLPAGSDLRHRGKQPTIRTCPMTEKYPNRKQGKSSTPIVMEVEERQGSQGKNTNGESATQAIKTEPPTRVVNWLKDSNMLPHEIANVRVLNFEYTTDIHFENEARATVARVLVDQLHQKRRNCSARNLLFITCGMGGILLQAALTQRHTEKTTPRLLSAKSLLPCIIGIVLLVVKPFEYSDFTKPQDAAEHVADYWSMLSRKPADCLLQDTSRTLPFRLGLKMAEKGIPIKCFHPIGVTIPRVSGGLISSPLAKSDALMSRYFGPDDTNYLTVLWYLKDCIQRRQFFDAVKSRDNIRVKELLTEGTSPNLEDRFGKTALHQAALKGWSEILYDLIRHNADTALVDHNGRTALHLATMKGNDGMVQLLLGAGADPNVFDHKGQSPVMLARLLAEQTNASQDVWRTFRRRPLVEGPLTLPTPRPYQIDSSLPSSPEQRFACESFRAVIGRFYRLAHKQNFLQELRSIETKSIHEAVYSSDRYENPCDIGTEMPTCEWYHIPSNNPSWIKSLFYRLDLAEHLSGWAAQEQSGATPHSRFLRPEFSCNRSDESGVNMTLFMPYLNFESNWGRKMMSSSIIEANTSGTLKTDITVTAERNTEDDVKISTVRKLTPDQALIKGYLNHNLHVRRTLDQFYYSMLNTWKRDGDQVVYRHARSKGTLERDVKILMVDQLWLWVIGGTLITSFPQRWNNTREDKQDILTCILRYVDSTSRDPILTARDLAIIIVDQCSQVFNRRRDPPDPELQIFDFFQTAIGRLTDSATAFMVDFIHDIQELAQLNHQAQKNDQVKAREEQLLDSFNDITKESSGLTEIEDVLDELKIISMVLRDHNECLKQFDNALGCRTREVAYSQSVEILEMTFHAQRTRDAFNHLLDLKQKQANASEARTARFQAKQADRQGKTLLVFTTVTIIFLPLSFMAAFFAINIVEFPRNASGDINLHLRYVAKYIFGISIAVSAPLILFTFSINAIRNTARSILNALRARMTQGGVEQIVQRHRSDSLLYVLCLSFLTSLIRPLKHTYDWLALKVPKLWIFKKSSWKVWGKVDEETGVASPVYELPTSACDVFATQDEWWNDMSEPEEDSDEEELNRKMEHVLRQSAS